MKPEQLKEIRNRYDGGFETSGDVKALLEYATELEQRAETAQDDADKQWLDAIGVNWKQLTGQLWDTLDGECREDGVQANISKLFEHIEGWKQRAEQAEKAAAEMRDAILAHMTVPLEDGGPYHWCILCGSEGEDKNLNHAPTCPSVNAGQTYLSPAEVHATVKPLVVALVEAKEYLCLASLKTALEHARKKGWRE